jgi:hypothetical protein
MVKYAYAFAPGVTPLRSCHDHFRTNPAPAFWAQLPFHLPQRDDQSCGLASLAQVTSALLARRGRSPVDQDELAAALGKPDWTGGATLAELEGHAARAFGAFGVSAEVTRFHAHALAHELDAFRAALTELEHGSALLIANYLLGPILGVGLGHHTPVGAYDAGADRVLLLDTFRQGWEPYWAPLELLWAAMTTPDDDAGGAPRGYLIVRESPGAPP